MSGRMGPSTVGARGTVPSVRRRNGESGIRDVATLAGVSAATVSRVLNGAPSVRPESVERVLAAIAELGYRPNRLARNLRRQSVQMIGVVVSDIENPHFGVAVRALEDAAYRRGFRVLLCNTDEKPDKQRAYLEMLAEERAAGVILSPSNPAGEEIAQLLDLGIPIVAFDRTVADARADSVISDGEAATRAATEHLLEARHRRIAFVGGVPGVETADTRRAGYRGAMRAAGLEPSEVDGRFRIAGGRRALEALLERGEGATALVVANNLMAIGVLHGLAARGLRVPEDMALIALDDPFWAELVQPPLTVLAQPVREMAGAAMRLLLERIDGRRDHPQHEVFGFELRARKSVWPGRPPPSSAAFGDVTRES